MILIYDDYFLVVCRDDLLVLVQLHCGLRQLNRPKNKDLLS